MRFLKRNQHVSGDLSAWIEPLNDKRFKELLIGRTPATSGTMSEAFLKPYVRFC